MTKEDKEDLIDIAKSIGVGASVIVTVVLLFVAVEMSPTLAKILGVVATGIGFIALLVFVLFFCYLIGRDMRGK